jgi:branched-chain amino acid transport system substrate-binding protein
LEELSKKHGYKLSLLAVDHPGQEQKSQWLQIRREKPDYVLMWGWGVMNQVAIQEAANIKYPMENFIGAWWSGAERDVLPTGAASNGCKALEMHNVGSDYPVFADIQKYVVDTGKAAGAGDQIGHVLYNRGLYAAMLAAQATKKAQALSGHADITAAEMRNGMEALEITEELMTSLGMPNFGPSFAVSCANHGGPGQGAVSQWDAASKTWSLITGFDGSDTDVINALIEEDSMAYAKENNITLRDCN